MKFWLLTAAAVVCFLKDVSAECSNNPCPGTDYRSYSSCLTHQCPNTVVATGCTETKCSTIDCDTCSSSSSCCQPCCRPKCECSSVSCNTCSSSSSSSSACCQTCCPKQDCCTCEKREECCQTQPQHECCKDKTVPPVIPSFTLPNITIIINQSAPVVYNTLNQSCGGVTTVSNSTHIVTTTGTCSHDPKPNQPCCIITHQPPCPQPLPMFHHCPPPVQNYACGPHCFIQPQVVIPPPPQVIQPAIQPPPQVVQPVIQPPTPVMMQPQPVTGCYQYPMNHCPQQCYGGCYWPRQSGCLPTQQWPFIRCGYGGPYFGGMGGIGSYGGYGGLGGYIGQGAYGGYGSYGVGAQPFAG